MTKRRNVMLELLHLLIRNIYISFQANLKILFTPNKKQITGACLKITVQATPPDDNHVGMREFRMRREYP